MDPNPDIESAPRTDDSDDGSNRDKPAQQHVAEVVPRTPSLVVPLEAISSPLYPELSKARSILIIMLLFCVTTFTTAGGGLVMIGIPTIARDLQIPKNLLLWPSSAYALACGCCLLMAGSVADVVGNRIVYWTGILISGVCLLAAGAANSGTQFIMFRALQGVGTAMVFPTTISLVTTSFRPSRFRNISFGIINSGLCLGYQIGYITIGLASRSSLTWRFAFYLCGGISIGLFALSLMILPATRVEMPFSWRQLAFGIDWVGILLSSVPLGCLSYVFGVISGSLSRFKEPAVITLLVIACVLAPGFPLWMHYQEKRGKPALIPNSLWKTPGFPCICIMVFVCWGLVLTMDTFMSLFFQEVQLVSPLGTTWRLEPNVLLGFVTSLLAGLIIHRVPANIFLVVTILISAIAPLLMALVNPAWLWWKCVFWAVLLSPVCADTMFTVANVFITETFPKNKQALAGSVFEVNAQLGMSFGSAIMAIISQSATHPDADGNRTSPTAVMSGYRVVFWTTFSFLLLMALVGAFGLRRMRRLGCHEDLKARS